MYNADLGSAGDTVHVSACIPSAGGCIACSGMSVSSGRNWTRCTFEPRQTRLAWHTLSWQLDLEEHAVGLQIRLHFGICVSLVAKRVTMEDHH